MTLSEFLDPFDTDTHYVCIDIDTGFKIMEGKVRELWYGRYEDSVYLNWDVKKVQITKSGSIWIVLE